MFTQKTLLACLALVTLPALGACAQESSTLTNGRGVNQSAPRQGSSSQGENANTSDNGTAGSTTGAEFSHAATPAANGAIENNVTPAEARAQGAPELTSRLHGCGKPTVASIGNLLNTRGLTGGGQLPQGATSGMAIFRAGDTAAALGAANFNGRVPEAPFASTSAVSKLFDIFTMASYDGVADDWTATACPGTKILEGGQFTKDGLSCLMGKPATDAHVAVANKAIDEGGADDGPKIAIAALLAASHTCQ